MIIIDEKKPEGYVSLYDLNKQLVSQLQPLNDDKLISKKELIRKYAKSVHPNVKYFMLVGWDLHYFTLFAMTGNDKSAKFENEVIECLEGQGKIISIEKLKEVDAIECWVSSDNGTFVLMLFPYDMGVLPCQ